MVKYKYIGKTVWFYGKSLWEIIGNLKGGGVGRLITRSVYERYNEPCFFKIVKMEAIPIEETGHLKNRKCVVWVEKVHRGIRYPQLIQMEQVTYKPDFRLIPKDQEEKYYNRVKEVKMSVNVPPTHIPVPPLLATILNEERKARGEPVKEKMVMEAKTNKVLANKVALSTLKKIPEYHVGWDAGLTKTASLYDNIEEYKAKFLSKQES